MSVPMPPWQFWGEPQRVKLCGMAELVYGLLLSERRGPTSRHAVVFAFEMIFFPGLTFCDLVTWIAHGGSL